MGAKYALRPQYIPTKTQPDQHRVASINVTNRPTKIHSIVSLSFLFVSSSFFSQWPRVRKLQHTKTPTRIAESRPNPARSNPCTWTCRMVSSATGCSLSTAIPNFSASLSTIFSASCAFISFPFTVRVWASSNSAS